MVKENNSNYQGEEEEPRVIFERKEEAFGEDFTIDVLLRIFKQMLQFELSIYEPIVFICLLQSTLAGIYQISEFLYWKWFKRNGAIMWSEQVVVVTGGASGFGWLLAQCFVQKFATVAVIDILEPANPQDGIYYYPCDITDFTAVEKTLKLIKEEFGAPTILINNAGFIYPKLLVESSIQDIERTLKVNLTSHFYTTKVVLPWMLEENCGHIVTISSILGYSSPAQATAYAASKAGLMGYHESLAQELESRYENKVKSLLVVPGHMETGMFNGVEHNYKFFFPTVQPLSLIKKIFLYLEYQRSGEIYEPFYANLTPFARCFPLLIKNWVYGKTGANQSLINWTGHLRDKNTKRE